MLSLEMKLRIICLFEFKPKRTCRDYYMQQIAKKQKQQRTIPKRAESNVYQVVSRMINKDFIYYTIKYGSISYSLFYTVLFILFILFIFFIFFCYYRRIEKNIYKRDWWTDKGQQGIGQQGITEGLSTRGYSHKHKEITMT